MAAEKIAYSDPTAQIMQMFTNLGGTENKSSSSGTSTTANNLDPALMAGLQRLFSTQMGQTTPEGMAALIGSVFKEGSKQAPVLATQFAQAAGARVSNNTPLMNANMNLQAQLAQKATEMVMNAQQQAGTTGTNLANLTKTTTQTENKGQTAVAGKPKANVMQLLPFLLANGKKIKDLLPNFATSGAGNGAGSVSMFGSGLNQQTNLEPNTFGFSNAEFGNGYSGSSYGGMGGGDLSFADSGGDAVMEFFSDFGGGDLASSALESVDWGGMFDAGDVAADVDWGSMFDAGDIDFGFADGGLVDAKKALASRKNIDDSGDGATFKKGSKADVSDATVKSEKQVKPVGALEQKLREVLFGAPARAVPGYADGGRVNRTTDVAAGEGATAGFQSDIRTDDGGTIRGITYNGTDSILPMLDALFGVQMAKPAKVGSSGGGVTASNGAGNGMGSPQAVAAYDRSVKALEPNPFNGAGDAIGDPSTVGTVSENAAAVNGMGIAVASAALGVPAAVLGMVASALGMPNTSMNPMSNIMSAITSLATTGGLPNSMDGLPGTMSAPDADGFSAPNDGLSMGEQDAAPSDSSGGAVGPSAAGVAGDSSGADGDGGVGASGTGGDGWARGGAVSGPGTETSDSIVARLSDGEFVVNAEATEQFLPILEAINAFGLKKRGGK